MELSAETTGILAGHQEHRAKEPSLSGKGWLVGIKTAAFHRKYFRIGTTVRTETR